MHSRDDVYRELYDRLKSLDRVGVSTAHKCALETLDYLDELVSQSGGSDPDVSRDEDGIECIPRPSQIPMEYNYIYWAPLRPGDSRYKCWAHPHKPVNFHLSVGHYTCDGIEEEGAKEISLFHALEGLRVENFVSTERLDNCTPEDRILRLVDSDAIER